MQRAAIWFLEVLLVCLAVLAGRWLQTQFTLIPRWLINLPGVTLLGLDFEITLAFLVAVSAAVFGLMAWLAGPGVFQRPQRTAAELYALVFAMACGALLLFLTTEVNFDAQLLAQAALAAFVLFVLTHLLVAISRVTSGNPLPPLGTLARAALINLRSPWAIIALVFAAMPPVMAKLYVANRDFANLVTQTRMIFSVQDTAHWELEPALQGVGFLQPIMLQFPPDGAAKIYVLERAGRLWRADLDGQNKELLLDFTRRVGLVDIENGALGFDQHPEFGRAGANAGFVYIYYTDLADGRQLNRLSRFDLAAADPAARLASESVLIEFRRNNSGFHNGGSVEFGPDRFLYLAIGEATNIPNHQRIDRDLLGGVLRIDVDRRGGAISHPPLRQPLSGKTGNYFIPNDNPFVGQPDALEEFWAIGLRNPFRIAFDSATGRLWTGDVGSTEWEEVNILENGGNYLDCTPAVRQGN